MPKPKPLAAPHMQAGLPELSSAPALPAEVPTEQVQGLEPHRDPPSSCVWSCCRAGAAILTLGLGLSLGLCWWG